MKIEDLKLQHFVGEVFEEEKVKSRFMPNVMFKVTGDEKGLPYIILNHVLDNGFGYFRTNTSGEDLLISTKEEYDTIYLDKVSFYEACPESVPEGMVYDKGSDSLKPTHKDIYFDENSKTYRYSGDFNKGDVIKFSISDYEKLPVIIKTPLEDLVSKFSFSEKQVEFIIKEFGMDEAENVLQFCQSHNINPLSLKMML